MKVAILLNTPFYFQLLLVAVFLTLLKNEVRAEGTTLAPETRANCERILTDSLNAQGEWSSVHGAEYLIRLDMTKQVLAVFRPQSKTASPPFRIGVWRVLAQAEPSADARLAYEQKIRSVLLDEAATDRLHALESLAKLGAPIRSPRELKVVQQMTSSDFPGCSFALWRLYQQRASSPQLEGLVNQLRSPDVIARLRAGFVLSQLENLPATIHSAAIESLSSEPMNSAAYPYMASAAGSTMLQRLLNSEDSSQRALAIRELALRSEEIPLSLPEALENEKSLALRQSAAFALLFRESDALRQN